MFNFIFGIPLNLGVGSWTVIGFASFGFLVMFGISSAMGDFQGLVTTTLENDAKSRVIRKKNQKRL
tara:strand:- start:3489 stop:3686 length:198 start_codon:yes stop_codon:yes gene_type:complete